MVVTGRSRLVATGCPSRKKRWNDEPRQTPVRSEILIGHDFPGFCRIDQNRLVTEAVGQNAPASAIKLMTCFAQLELETPRVAAVTASR
jgi:hypothetical protein